MSDSRPLMRGGVLKHERFNADSPDSQTPASFATTTMPTIYTDTVIVAAASPNVQKGHPAVDGWFLSDFYAFNYLLNGAVPSQTWLTAADPRKLLKAHPNIRTYLHGNPYQERKVVLSEEMLDNNMLSPVKVVKNTKMIDTFLDEIRRASKEAKSKNAPLLLLVFCHGDEHFQLLLDHGSNKKGLSVTRVKEAIEPGCKVTLLTTACYSGGWLVLDLAKHPDHDPLDTTGLTAASKKDTSMSWSVSDSIGRACGSVFAATVIRALEVASSPLLPDEEQDRGDDGDMPLQPPPEEATPAQTQTYNAFCSSVNEICQTRVSRLFDRFSFTFSAQNNEWDHSWIGRSGIPLVDFKARWDRLASVPFAGCLKKKNDMDTDPDNPAFKGRPGECLVGGRVLVEKMTTSISKRDVPMMAKCYLQTCPGDWDTGCGLPMYRPMMLATERNWAESLYDESETFDLIAERWNLALLADYIVETFHLARPQNRICILWDSVEWPERSLWTHEQRQKGLIAYGRFSGCSVSANSRGYNHPPLVRFGTYLATAVGKSTMSVDEAKIVSADIMLKVDDIQRRSLDDCVRSIEVVKRGRDWLRSMGRRVRRSMTPRKSI